MMLELALTMASVRNTLRKQTTDTTSEVARMVAKAAAASGPSMRVAQ